MIENQIRLDSVIRRALEEDLGAGDLTTDAIIASDALGKAVLESRERIVLSGLFVFSRVFTLLSSEIEFDYHYKDGQIIPSGVSICNIAGPLSVILKAERTALNFLQRMSGIATQAREFVDKAGTHRVKILDTRKTAPCLRLMDKYAVRVGGGFNHRMGLFDGILIKDNHIAAAGSISEAVRLARENSPHTLKIEVEAEDLAGVEEAVLAGADVILLDNMSPNEMRAAVNLAAGRVKLEASGGITMANIEEIAATGVDYISIGALSHSVRAVDISLEVVPSQ